MINSHGTENSWNCMRSLRNFNPCRLFKFARSKHTSGTETKGMSKRFKLDASASSSSSTCSIDSSMRSNNVEGKRNQNYKVLPLPEKPPCDKKDYNVIKLSNGLTAMLITDYPLKDIKEFDTENDVGDDDNESLSSSSSVANSENALTNSDVEDSENEDGEDCKKAQSEEKIAACALCVNVGGFSDPPDIPGLAHFLEHMVFMGSAKYPKENEFDSFIKRKGGSDNAHTQCEYTTFYFECQEEYLKKALDIFSQFFIAPLMKFEAITREREAIESEFQLAVPSDNYRREQLLCSLADEENPVRKFMWGNLITLRDNVDENHLYKSVHEFRERHYSAHRMTLAVQARLPQDVLASWVEECFSDVKNNELPPAEFPILSEPFRKSDFSKIYYVDPVSDICSVEMSWVLPSTCKKYKTKPLEYISWLIGHEGKHSLLSYIKSHIWGLEVTAGEEDDYGSNSLFSVFNIKVSLTEEGLEKLSQVLDAVFSYIKLLQTVGPSERVFKELQKVSEINYNYSEEMSAMDNVESLVEDMHLYPPEHFLCGPELYFNFDSQDIQNYLNLLDPDRVNIIVSSKKLKRDYKMECKEKWFGTRYSCEDIPPKWLENWRNINPYECFQLPEPNLYIPEDFCLIKHDENKAIPKYPRKILEDSNMEIWYREDTKFLLPQAYFYINFITPLTQKSPLNAALAEIYVNILKEQLGEEVYPALMAQSTYDILSYDKGLSVKVSGFSHKLHLLLEKVIDRIVSVEKYMTPAMFEAIKKLHQRYYINSNLKAPVLAKDLRMSVTLKEYWSKLDKLKVLSGISFEGLKEFSRELLEQAFMQVLIQGNVEEVQGVKICKWVRKRLQYEPLPINQIPFNRVCQLPKGDTHIRINSFNRDSNSITTVFFQSGPGSIKDFCIVELLQTILEEPVFDILRTQEQLGYDVSCSMHDTFGILGFTVNVVSQIDKFSMEHVEKRIEKFLETSKKNLKKMSKAEFQESVDSLIKIKQCSDTHLKEEVKRNWEEISDHEYVFDRLEKQVDCLQKIKIDDVRAFFSNQLGNDRKKLVIQVAGIKKPEEGINENSVDVVDYTGSNMNLDLVESPVKNSLNQIIDIPSFKKYLTIYPVHKVTS